MVPESEIKKRSENNMEAPDSKEKVAVNEVESEYQTCVSNYEDYTFELDASLATDAGEERTMSSTEVDVVNIRHSDCNALVEKKCQDTTESSSSFDDVFGVENGGTLSDDEVVSDFREDSFNGHGEMFSMRKKRLTSHWRTHIRPLMWRCKWVELQIKKLSMHERNYAKELSKYNQEESFQVERPTIDLSSTKVPYSDGRQTHQVLKRRKRKRIEDIVDVTTYLSHHNLFSYYENRKTPADGICFHNEWRNLENKKDPADGICLNDERRNLENKKAPAGGICFHDEQRNLENKKAPADGICFHDDRRNLEKVNCNDEFGINDISYWLESSETGELVVRKIEILKGQVSNLKTRLDKVTSVSAVKVSYAANPSLRVPCNALTSSGLDSASPPNNGDRVAVGSSYIASQLRSQYHMRDVVPPESAVSSHGAIAHLSDIIERRNQPELGGPCHIEDEILIYNRRMRDGMNNFEKVEMQPPAAVRVDQGNPVQLDLNVLMDDQPPKRTRSISELTIPMIRRSQRRRKRRRF